MGLTRLMGDITQIFEQIQPGDERATERLLPVVYDELRRLAKQKLFQEPTCNTLQTTALVHEAYLRLVGSSQQWNGKGHFFSAAGEAMRRILVDRARAKKRQKRGGDRRRVDIQISALHLEPPADDVLALHECLDLFAEKYPAKADLVKLRYFAGFTTSEAAQALEITTRTAERYWAFAKAWLYHEMNAP